MSSNESNRSALPEHYKYTPMTFKMKAGMALFLYGFSMVVPVVEAFAASVASTATKQVEAKEYIVHVMQAGDSVASVAKQYGVSIESLEKANSIFGGHWTHRALLVPRADIAGSVSFGSSYNIYVLGKAETLTAVAGRFNRSVKELTNLNELVMPMSKVIVVKEGDSLLVPAVSSSEKNVSVGAVEQKLAPRLSSIGETLSNSDIDSHGQYFADQAKNQVGGMATSAAAQGIESLLSKKGKAKVGISANVDTGDVDYSIDYLHPLLETEGSTTFGQVGLRTSNEREIGSVGLGYRKEVTDDLMLGANVFLDQDFSRDHTRASVGVEAWVEAARLSANYYTPLSGWKKSKDHELNSDPENKILEERAAKGWDVNVDAPIPGYQQLAVTGKYFQWKGDKVDVQGSRNDVEKNPKGYSAGIKWQPVPLVGFTADHSKVTGSDSDFSAGMDLTWSFDRSLKDQLDGTKAYAVKPLDQARKEFVNRNYEMVLEYREKDKPVALQPFEFPVSNISGIAGQQGQGPVVTGAQPTAQVVYTSSMPDVVAVDSTTGHLSSNALAASAVVVITAAELMQVNKTNQKNTSRTATYSIDLKAQQFIPSVSDLDINGVLQVGQTLVGSFVFSDNDPDPSNDESNNASTMLWTGGGSSGIATREYQLTANDAGKILVFNVTPTSTSGQTGAVASITTANAPSGIGGNTNPPGVVVDPGSIPSARDLDITGVLQVGSTISGQYTFADNDGDDSNDAVNDASTVLWTGGANTSNTTKDYSLSSADAGQILTFNVTPKTVAGTVGTAISVSTANAPSGIGGGTTPPGTVVDPGAIPSVRDLDISGVLQVGSTITGQYTFADNDGDDGNDVANDASDLLWTGGATSGISTKDYALGTADAGHVLTFNVRPKTVAGVVGTVARVSTADAPSGIGGGTNPPGVVVDPSAIPSVRDLDITGVLQVGSTITGQYTFADNDGDDGNDVANDASDLLWTGGGTSGITANGYALTVADAGQILTFNVTPKTVAGIVGTLASVSTADAPSGIGGGTTPPGVVVDPGAIPTVSDLDITGVLQVGSTITGQYTFADNDGDNSNDAANDASNLLWTGGGTPGITANGYALTAADTGQVLTFNVTPKTAAGIVGTLASVSTANAPSGIGGGTTPPGIVIDPAAPLSVTVVVQGGGALTGRPQVGQTLEASVVCEKVCGPLTYQWSLQSSENSQNFDEIPGATSVSYTPLASQQRRELRVKAQLP